MTRRNVAVVGAGYWGKNLVRIYNNLGVLHTVCDRSADALQKLTIDPDVYITSDFPSVLRDPEVAGVVIAAPAAQHYELTRQCLLADKDVFVEKPLALHVEEGNELVALASQRQRVLMVGHILLYHPAVLALKELVRNGDLGKIQYLYSSRLNLGKLRTEENILWSFAPHDVAVILHLLDEMPQRVFTTGGYFLSAKNADTTLTTCEFESGAKAHIFVSWLHPFKEQKFTVVGGRKMAVFDDAEADRKLVLYSHRIEWVDRVPVAHKHHGDVMPVAEEEPLRRECMHFLECMETRSKPRTDGESAVRVLQVLDACERSLREGRTVEVMPSRSFEAHSSAIIDPGCEIGEGTKIWHFTHVMDGSKIGSRCNIGQNVLISGGVKIGNNVKIQNNVSVYTGVELEDDVFCGPSMVFTNVVNPRSHVNRKAEYRRTLVQRGASIGANATILCGTTLGRFSFIGAGAVVTRDVPDYALVMGVPAKQVGWVCYCGVSLKGAIGDVVCASCSRSYRIANSRCQEVTPKPIHSLSEGRTTTFAA